MPWKDDNQSPVYLDIRRFIPVGDVFDLGQGHAALPIPPALMPGGPLALIGEIIANRSMFTGRPITLETDTAAEQASKDRKSTRRTPVTNAHLVCRLLLEKKKHKTREKQQ